MSDERMTRREWLARGGGAVAIAAAATASGVLLHNRREVPYQFDDEPDVVVPDFFAKIDFPASSPHISIALGSLSRIDRMVRAAVDGLAPREGIRCFVKPGDAVLIKPNVGFDRPPHMGATTNPEVLACVIRLCREAGAREVVVADNPIE